MQLHSVIMVILKSLTTVNTNTYSQNFSSQDVKVSISDKQSSSSSAVRPAGKTCWYNCTQSDLVLQRTAIALSSSVVV